MPRLFNSIKISVRRGFNTVMSEFQQYYVISSMKVSLSKPGCPCQLNCILLQTDLRGLLIYKDCRSLDLSFPFVFKYVDKWKGFSEDEPLPKIQVEYPDASNHPMSDTYSTVWCLKGLENMREKLCNFKKHFLAVVRSTF